MTLRRVVYVICFLFIHLDIRASEMIESLTSEIGKVLNINDVKVSVDSVPASLKAPYVWTQLSFQDQHRRFSVKVTDSENKNIILKGKLEWMIEVPTVSRMLRHGDIIQPSDLNFQKLSEKSIDANVIVKSEGMVGKSVASAFVRPGIPIRYNEVKDPLWVRKGDLVQIAYKTKSLRISRPGTAENDGSKGSVISVLVSPMNRLQARVVAPGEAEVRA